MRRIVRVLVAAFAVVVPAIAHADSDGYYCIGPNYIAYQFGVGNPSPVPHRLFVLRLGGPAGIGAPVEFALPAFQVQAMICTDRAVRLLAYDAIYTVALDATRRPLRVDRAAIASGTSPPEFFGQWANLGMMNRAVDELKADSVVLMKDAAGHVFTLEVYADTTATRWCDPDARARIVETAPTGAVVRERIIPPAVRRPAACPNVGPANPPVPHVDPPLPSTASAVHIESAYSDPDGTVCFDLPKGFANWPALAIQARGAAAVANPRRDSLRAHYVTEFRGSTLRYSMRPAQTIVSSNWLVLHDAGATNAPATELRGEIGYSVNRALRIIGPPAHSGRACGHPASRMRAAFALIPRSAGTWTSEPVRVDTTRAGEYAVTVNGDRHSFKRDASDHPGVRLARVIRPPAGPPLLLVAWPDGLDTCENNYTLFEPGARKELRVLRTNAYGCDV